MVSRTLSSLGYSLFEQLLPRDLQELYWTVRGRNVRTLLILSDEPYIPWELIKPYRENPATGEFEEAEFWGHSYALTHWLRGRPPAGHRFSFNRIFRLGSPDRGRFSAGWWRRSHGTRHRSASLPSCPPRPDHPRETSAWLPISADEELAVLRASRGFGLPVPVAPGPLHEILKAFEAGDFDLLHLVAHGEFAGSSAADASAVLMEDGPFRVAELSPEDGVGVPPRSAPLIFFNSCHSGRLGFSLTRLGSSGCPVRASGLRRFRGDPLAGDRPHRAGVRRGFLRGDVRGQPIGEAMLWARRHVHGTIRTTRPGWPTAASPIPWPGSSVLQ